MSQEWRVRLVCVLMGVLVTVGTQFLLYQFKISGPLALPENSENADENTELHLGRQDLVNPLIDCNSNKFGRSPRAFPIEEAVRDYIESARTAGKVRNVAVHYRDLNNGPGIGINADELFVGASLLKVPLLIDFMRRAENDPKLLSQTLVFDPSKLNFQPYGQSIDPPPPLIPGQAYTVNTLLARMIAYSDNGALATLTSMHNGVNVLEVLRQMGVKIEEKSHDLYLSVQSYASIFRILYNATYLTPSFSNASLEILTKTHFNGGLKAKLPTNIVIAHKFGERTHNGDLQFHDCGIIYFPERPYQLCIMTRGEKMQDLIAAVADISGIIYEKVTAETGR